MKIFKDKESGVYKVRIMTPQGWREITTGTRNAQNAREVIRQAGIEEIETAARVGQLSAAVISRVMTGGNLTMRKAVDLWVEWLTATGKSPNTVNNYQIMMWSFIKRWPHLVPALVNENHVGEWVNKRGASMSTRLVRLSAIRSFFEFCIGKGFTASHPPKLVRIKGHELTHEEKEAKERKPFTPEEIGNLMEACKSNDNREFWAHAIQIGRLTGLRLGDIACLERATMRRPGIMVVWTDKRDRRVEIPISPEMEVVISNLPRHNPRVFFPRQRELSRNAARRSGLSTQFSRLCQSAGVTGKSFHCLRHTYLTELAMSGMPIEEIRKRAGHICPSTTERYIHCGENKIAAVRPMRATGASALSPTDQKNDTDRN